MNKDVKERLDKLKEDARAEPIPTLGVLVSAGTIAKINDHIRNALHGLTVPQVSRDYYASKKNAAVYLDRVREAHVKYENILNYIIDEVLQLADNPKVQAYRLAGAIPKAESNFAHDVKYWYMDLVSERKDKPLRIVFGYEILYLV